MMRALGVDDGFFPERRGTAPVIGVLMRGTLVEGVLYGRISVDGVDVTDALLRMLSRSRFSNQPRAIFTSGTVFAGTNVLDLHRLHDALGIPVIAVLRKPPSDAFVRALERSPNADVVLLVHRRNPSFFPLRTKRGNIYVAPVGIDPSDVKRLVEDYQIYSAMPEPVRLAHLVASAIGLGESRGRP